ncbi:hypothetical protein GYMLUDRAFT_34091 [Collybiopsis luxurians FD-317 M1]|nr:hypothetical protein GYMLUDRAFT_34091 [Collybiopsis luxurians FD-317 M1]
MSWLSSRFDSFPSELVAIIFELGTFSERGKIQHNPDETPFVFDSSRNSNNYDYIPRFPITVSHVSRRWREIALNAPALWSTLYFEHPSHLERGRVFLERCSPRTPGSPEFCSGFLLDIVIATVSFKRKKAQSDNCSISQEELQKIFNLLTPVTVRWRSFYLRVRDSTCKQAARDALGRDCGRAPNLETLQLYHFEDYNNVDDLIEATIRFPVICFANSVPKLRHLSLIGVNLPWADTPYLEGLETLELALHPDKIRPQYQYWDKMLRLSPDLKKLILHYSGPRERWDEDDSHAPTYAWQGDDLWRLNSDLPADRIVLEQLVHLSLTDMDAPYLSRILEHIHLPNVQTLVLELSSEEDESDYSNFLEKCIGAGMSIAGSTSVRLSQSSDLSIPPTSDILAVDKMTPPLFPFLSTLSSLTLSALDCKLSTLQSFLACLPMLRELEVDFSRVCVGDSETYLESSLTWRIFADDAPIMRDVLNSLPGGAISSSSRQTLSHPQPSLALLPKLRVFKIQRLGGRQVEAIIRKRECLDLNPPCEESASSSSYTPPFRAFDPDVIPARQKCTYVVKYTKDMVEEDRVLAKLIASGYCYFRTHSVENGWDARFESSEYQSEDRPSAVLRRFEPELESYRRPSPTKRAGLDSQCTCDVNGWTKVVVQSEMINGEESDPSEEEDGYGFTDEESGSDSADEGDE